MNDRRGFLGILAGLFALPQSPCYKFNDKSIVGERVPCKEGEEYCPLGHSQKPQPMYAQPADIERYNHDSQMLMMYTGAWIEPRSCKVCGIVYLPVKSV